MTLHWMRDPFPVSNEVDSVKNRENKSCYRHSDTFWPSFLMFGHSSCYQEYWADRISRQCCEGKILQIDSIVQLGLSSELCDLIKDLHRSSFLRRTPSNFNTRGMLKHLIKLYWLKSDAIPPSITKRAKELFFIDLNQLVMKVFREQNIQCACFDVLLHKRVLRQINRKQRYFVS